jgi:hypothetical protein
MLPLVTGYVTWIDWGEFAAPADSYQLIIDNGYHKLVTVFADFSNHL